MKDIDNIIYIKILNHNINSILYNIITNNMMHDSYNSIYLNLLYMKNEKYSKKYSWQFYNKMISNENDYLIY